MSRLNNLLSRPLPKLLLLGLVLVSAQSAWAHRFGVVLIAPLSGPAANAGKAFVDGFSLATREQDSHAMEESDGHLGGLDSYIYPLDSELDMDSLNKQLNRLIAREQPTFLGAMIAPGTRRKIDSIKGSESLVLVKPESSAVWNAIQTTPDTLSTFRGKSFSQSFERAFNYPPGGEAYQGYVTARLIATTVRSLEQNPAENRQTTRTTLTRAEAQALSSD